MGLLDLFVVSSIPTVKVLLVTAVGAFLALDRVNLLGEDARKHFNSVVFYVFNPPLIATNLVKTVTLESTIKLWFMPVNILITFIIGSAFGWIVIQITKAPSHLRGLVLGCCAASKAPLVIARGGVSGLFPSSSDASFNFFVDSSLQSVVFWCDVQLTKDAFVICIHDVTINGYTSIEFVYPNGSTTYVVNGEPTLGWFSIDYTLADLQNVTSK